MLKEILFFDDFIHDLQIIYLTHPFNGVATIRGRKIALNGLKTTKM